MVSPNPLSEQQIAEFRANGFIIARIFEPEDLEPLKAEISRFVDDRARRALAAGEITRLHEDKEFSHRMGYLVRECGALGRKFDISNLRGREMFKFMAHPKLLAALSPLFDGEITCSSVQHLRIKPPSHFSEEHGNFYNVPWHQDSGVAQPESDASLIVTCWCPIGPATEEMGCMRLIPGIKGHLIHESSPEGTRIRSDLMPETEPIVAACEEGEVVVMSQFTPHYSTPNRSDRCRWSMDLRFQKTGTPSARPWLPEFVVASKSDPNSKFADYSAWREMWAHPTKRPKGLSNHRIG